MDGKAVTTSRKLARLIGRKHDSVVDTIKSNLQQRQFKYGNFIRRPYKTGSAHGYEYLITRRGLKVLTAVMRGGGVRDRIAEAYESAWSEPTRQIIAAPGLPLQAAEPEPEPMEVQAVEVQPEESEEEIKYTPEQQKYIDWLEKYNAELGEKLRKARATLKVYAEEVEYERQLRKRREKRLWLTTDLYEDLEGRMANSNGRPLGECLNEHYLFRSGLLCGGKKD